MPCRAVRKRFYLMDLEFIKSKKLAELREIAAALKIEGAAKLRKKDILAILTEMYEEAKAAEELANAAAGVSKVPEEASGFAESAASVPASKRKAAEVEPEEKKPAKRGRPRKKPLEPESEGEAEEASLETKAVSLEGDGLPEEELDDEELLDEDNGRNGEAEERAADGRRERKYSDRYETTGVLDLADGGFGFLRFDNFISSDRDVYVSPTQIRRFNLKTGDEIFGVVREPGEGERFGALLFVKTVNGDEPGAARRRPDFSDLTPIYPDERIVLEEGSSALSMRLTDLVAPIGLGQRGLIVAPPKAGKTTLLKQIAKAIENQGLDAELIVLLIDERPEEVTDMQRSINGHVIYSTFDEQPSHHVKVAEMVLARAQRLVEHGKNVIVLLDSITRLARAYNLVEPPSGRTLSGGLDPAALYKPKKFFGAARNIEEGGSITVLATALIETGSRMDDMIFEEFKGTGNMELHLDRNLSEKRIFPAINLNKSGTRREDMLMSPEELEAVWLMRRALADWGTEAATERIVLSLAQTRSNSAFIERFRKARI